jgi:CRISPR-associated protein (TIGR03986 family)
MGQISQPGLEVPYDFIPLSSRVYSPDWADRVSHDVPFQDGLCGSFELTIEATTALFTRDDIDGEHFLNHDGRYFLKGTSLRGMLRNVMGIIAYGRFDQVDERRFGIRDISSSKTPYAEQMRKAKAGWLRIERDETGRVIRRYIQPCEYARVWGQRKSNNPKTKKIEEKGIEGNLEDLQRSRGSGWRFEQSMPDKYANWKGDLRIRADFKQEGSGASSYHSLCNLERGQREGVLVFTGHVHSKRRDFFFYASPGNPPEIEISDENWRKFEWAHSGSQQRSEIDLAGQEPNETWGYLKQWLEPGKASPWGEQVVPVFYLKSGSELEAFGLASMFRMPSEQSVYGAISQISREHLGSAPDMPDLIFGCLPRRMPDGKHVGDLSLKGRVSITHAPIEEGTASERAPVTLVLGSPKPSFHLAYLQQTEKKELATWGDKDARVAGWKFYPARGEAVQRPPITKSDTQNTTMRPLRKGAKFRARVYFHNLKPQELGALLWCIDFNDRVDRGVHRIGMARSQGYGEVRLGVENFEAEANDWQNTAPGAAECVRLFEKEMLGFDSNWLASSTITTFLSMVNPSVRSSKEERKRLRHMELAEFKAAKNRALIIPEAPGLHDLQDHLDAQQSQLHDEFARERIEQFLDEFRSNTSAARAEMLMEEWGEVEAKEYVVDALKGADWSDSDALAKMREALVKLHAKVAYLIHTPIPKSEFDALTEDDLEAVRARIEVLHMANWSTGKTSMENIGKSTLKGYAEALRRGDGAVAGVGVAAVGASLRPELVRIQQAEHRKVPITDAGNAAMDTKDWSTDELVILWQWVKDEGLNQKRSKSKNWAKKFEKFLQQHCPETLE